MGTIFHNGNKFSEFTYNLEKEFEQVVKSNSKLLFGNSTIYVDLKARISSTSLGETIPDGLLFDLKDIDNPDFYLVEIELAKHDFYRHIFTQVTKFIAFFRNPQARSQLIERVYFTIQSDKQLEQEFKHFLKGKEIFKFMKDSADDSQNILMVIDEMKPELPEILSTYTEWNKMVKVLVLKEYRSGEEKLLSLSPEFETVELGENPGVKIDDGETGAVPHTEEYHLEGTEANVKETYAAIKAQMLQLKPGLRFNPKKYYISIVDKKNFAYIYVRKKKLVLVIMLPETVLRSNLKNHHVGTYSDKVQKFYGGECAAVNVEDTSNLDEVVGVLKMAIDMESK